VHRLPTERCRWYPDRDDERHVLKHGAGRIPAIGCPGTPPGQPISNPYPDRYGH
jgi:hypothetical protein